MDKKLGLNVVPATAVVELAAPTFYYGRIDRAKARTKERIHSRYPDLGRRFHRIGLPPKVRCFSCADRPRNVVVFMCFATSLSGETAVKQLVADGIWEGN